MTLPTPTNTGYTFSGWFSSAQGGSLVGMGGALYTPSSSVTLYAQWQQAPNFVVSFLDNGGVGSSPPLSGAQESVITIPAAPGVNDVGYSFAGWNTAANGSGVAYVAGQSLVLSGSLVLYAQWQELPMFGVSFSNNGGVGSMPTVSGLEGTWVTLPQSPTLIEAGSTFTGWNTAANGSGVSYASGQSLLLSNSLELYAQWQPSPSIVVSVFGNGINDVPGPITASQGSTVTIPSAPSTDLPGSTFVGWNTAANGTGVAYTPGQAVVLNAPLTLFAQWQKLPNFVVIFDLNGGTGSMARVTSYQGSTILLPAASVLARPGYTFTGWNTAPGGKGASYGADSKIVLSRPITLYAQWTGHAPALLLSAIGPFAGKSTVLSAGLSQQVQTLARLIKRHHYTHVTLYGYSGDIGSNSKDLLCSRRRAEAVAALLRSVLVSESSLKVTITTAGEGFTPGLSVLTSHRVEVFVR